MKEVRTIKNRKKQNTTNKIKATRKNMAFFGMLFFNVIMLITVIHMFSIYVSDKQVDMMDNGIQNITNNVKDISSDLENNLNNNKAILYKYVEYIEGEELSLVATVKYLEHWIDFYDEINIIPLDSFKAISIKLTENGVERWYSDYYRGLDKKLEEDHFRVDVRSLDNIFITNAFTVEGEEGLHFVIYAPVRIEGKDYVLSLRFPMSSLSKVVNDVMGLVGEHAIIIDGTGQLLVGKLPDDENGNETTNFIDFFRKNHGDQMTKELIDAMEKDDAGIFEIESNKEQKWVCIFSKLSGTKKWTFMYNENQTGLIGGNNKRFGPEVFMIVCMFIWLCIDILGYYTYNRKLKKMIITIDEQNKNLQAANMAKNIFISNMSHEIRTPINAVLGMDEMILRETDDEQIREYAHDIKNAGKVLLGLINDILDYSKIESGKMEIIDAEYDIGSVVNDLCNIIDLKIKDKGLKLELNVNPDIPHELYGDELRIKQIILNILTNAVKYTEKGTVTFSLDYEKKDEKEIYLRISVADTGIGMKAEEMDKLFKAFERLDEKRNRSIEGTGLGMSIVTRLLEQMGSKLEVESEYGKGSIFSFALVQPVVDNRPVGNISEIRKNNQHSNNEESEAVLMASRAKLLVVDDTLVNLTVVKGLLKRTFIQVDTADSGQECLDMVAKKKYDMILLDHRMPQMDGIETLKRLKLMGDDIASIPVIALTANVVSGAHEMYLREGFTDFLSKPVNGNKLEKMILRYLPANLLDSEDDIAAMINKDAGLEACGSEDVYMQVLKEFTGLHEKNSTEISLLYEQRDIENYTIKVHALKSSARLAGAQNLSAEAAALEASGNAKDWNAIDAGTGKMLRHYSLVVSNIKTLFDIDSDTGDKPPIAENELKEAFKSIKELNDAFDFDSIDVIIESIEKYKLPDDKQLIFDKLKLAVYEFDQEQIKSLLDNV